MVWHTILRGSCPGAEEARGGGDGAARRARGGSTGERSLNVGCAYTLCTIFLDWVYLAI